ncbi:spore germination protein [Brevibacillus sp. TJ4]|uniref:spore germination protein n=1 Tax=Brevibacillus sp. TJ4 TaxID=3234853 RepID=UPI0037CD5455
MNRRTNKVDTSDLQQFLQSIHTALGNPPDLVSSRLDRYLILFFSGFVDQQRLEEEVIAPLKKRGTKRDGRFNTVDVANESSFSEVLNALLSGMVIIARQGDTQIEIVNVVQIPHRSVSEPQTEAVIRGPREGFTELLEINLALIRKRLRSEKLRVTGMKIGTLSKTEVCLLHMEGIAQPHIVEEMQRRLNSISIDAILESNYIEEIIRDHRYSIFPTMQYSERPDMVVGSLLEGKVAVLVDNTPMALIAPFQFWSGLQASEDYYTNFYFSTFIRMIRAVFIFMALLFPSLYVAITTFHHEMLPTNLLFSVAAAREATPFPALVEVLLMEITFEALREAGVRLPRPVGQAVSIVGALVIGQAAVQAGIVSAPMVIVVSITGIASFTIPRFNMSFALRILRFPLIVLAGSMGLFGILLGLFALTIYMTGIRSFGVPYLTPLAPLSLPGLKDLLIRAPFWTMHKRPQQMVKENTIRVPAQQPVSSNGGDGSGSTSATSNEQGGMLP